MALVSAVAASGFYPEEKKNMEEQENYTGECG